MIPQVNALQVEIIRNENLQLKQELAQLTAIGRGNASYVQTTGVVKRPHYYTDVGSQRILVDQDRRITELTQTVAKQDQHIRNYQASLLGVEKHFHNIVKIDQDIYKRLQPVSPNVRTLEEVKLAVKRGESREFISQILDRVVV